MVDINQERLISTLYNESNTIDTGTKYDTRKAMTYCMNCPLIKDAIHTLKTTNNHFARLFEEYHEIDHEVHRIETGAENTSDDYLEGKKLKRLHLKDELTKMVYDYEQEKTA